MDTFPNFFLALSTRLLRPQLDHPLRCRYLALGEDPAGSYYDEPHPSSAIRRCAADLHPYDSHKDIFSIHRLKFDTGSQEFDVTLADEAPSASGKGPKVYKIKLTHVAEINPEVLHHFIEGKGSHDNTVLTAIIALNVIIRMQPSLSYPFNVRSFFTDREPKNIGSGLELWCGYFQSVRQGIGKMLINVDISTGTMYKKGPLLRLCLEFMSKNHPNALSPTHGSPRSRTASSSALQLWHPHLDHPLWPDGQKHTTPRALKKLSTAPANKLTFTMREGQSMTVADYFQRSQNKPL